MLDSFNELMKLINLVMKFASFKSLDNKLLYFKIDGIKTSIVSLISI